MSPLVVSHHAEDLRTCVGPQIGSSSLVGQCCSNDGRIKKVHRYLLFLQASRQVIQGAPRRAELTQRIMLAQLQSAVYEEIASQAASEQRSMFGLRRPGLSPTVGPELTPGQFALYEHVPGSMLPTAQERWCESIAWLTHGSIVQGHRQLSHTCAGTPAMAAATPLLPS